MRMMAAFPIGALVLMCCSVQKETKKSQDITYATTAVEAMKPAEVVAVKDKVCPNDMVEISANYCPKTDERCLYWVTIDGKKTDINTDRCGEFRKPVHCLVAPVPKHFYIDRFEIPNIEGVIPRDWMSWYDVKKFCESEGKRLCTHSEWTTAASGDEYLPYPFGDGFHRRDANGKELCNMDNHIHGVDVLKVADPNEPGAIALRNLLVPSGSMKQCVSSLGVYDMSGNVDEFVVNESGRPYVSSLVGGHVFGVRNRSRPSTDAHAPWFHWYESSGRCCLNAE